MIPDAVLDFVFVVIDWITAQLPAMPNLSGLSGLGTLMAGVGMYVDLSTWGTVLGLIVALEGSILGVQLIIWLYEKLPLT